MLGIIIKVDNKVFNKTNHFLVKESTISTYLFNIQLEIEQILAESITINITKTNF